MSITATDLSQKMRALADTGHPRADELREKADAFDHATAQDREEIARIIDGDAWDDYARPENVLRRNRALSKADRILALRSQAAKTGEAG